ncbi:MAG: formylglycine-generating enzyme family protein [Planctomycetota bacterium]
MSRWFAIAILPLFFVGCSRDVGKPTAGGTPASQVAPTGPEVDTTDLAQEITNSIGMKLVLIPKGKFLMGSPETEAARDADEQQHEVTLSRDYYLGAYEVTQGQYKKVMGKNPSRVSWLRVWEGTSSYPVEQVYWEEAVEFCRRLSVLPEEQKSGRVYRLPTEAEWEYGCRAGSKTAYSFGDDKGRLDEYARYYDNSNLSTHPVGTKKPNPWGLYDMHGNVLEWCQDWAAEYDPGPQTDPTGPSEGSLRESRGGGWSYDAAGCRSAYRNGLDPSARWHFLGFRLALSPLEPQAGSK